MNAFSIGDDELGSITARLRSLLLEAVPKTDHGVQDFLGPTQSGQVTFARQVGQLGIGQSGHHVLSAEVKVDKEGKFGTGGNVVLRLDKKKVGEGRFEKQVAGYFTVNETFDVGCDTVSPVSDLYESPFAFTGTIIEVMVDVSEATFEELAEYHEIRARLAMATQ